MKMLHSLKTCWGDPEDFLEPFSFFKKLVSKCRTAQHFRAKRGESGRDRLPEHRPEMAALARRILL